MKTALPLRGKCVLAIETGKTVPTIRGRQAPLTFIGHDGVPVAVSGKRDRVPHALVDTRPKDVTVHAGWPITTAFTQYVAAPRHSHGLDIATALEPNADRTGTHASRLLTPFEKQL